MKALFGCLFAAFIFVLFFFLDPASYGLIGISLVEQRMVGIFLAAMVMYVTECAPPWVTSLIIIMTMILTVSTSSLWFLRDNNIYELGNMVDYRIILESFADPIIMLFLGGFTLAIAINKQKLDIFLARKLLKPFGSNIYVLLLGIILVTALISAFVSDTATAAIMFILMGPLFRSLPEGGDERAAFAMAIPIGALLGGLATPVGTPPNGIALKYLNDVLEMNVGFTDWALLMGPLTLGLLILGWGMLLFFFRFTRKRVTLNLEGSINWDFKTISVLVTFLLTILVWFTGKHNGVNPSAAAIIPLTLLTATGVINRQDVSRIEWTILWMVAGGFALGTGFQKTGLANNLIYSIPFDTWSPVFVLLGASGLCWFLSNFISNSATAALLIPILCAVGVGMGDSLLAVGGIKVLLMGIAMAASLAMSMPISTPATAIASSTGYITQKQMASVGVTIGIVGCLLGYIYLFLFF